MKEGRLCEAAGLIDSAMRTLQAPMFHHSTILTEINTGLLLVVPSFWPCASTCSEIGVTYKRGTKRGVPCRCLRSDDKGSRRRPQRARTDFFGIPLLSDTRVRRTQGNAILVRDNPDVSGGSPSISTAGNVWGRHVDAGMASTEMSLLSSCRKRAAWRSRCWSRTPRRERQTARPTARWQLCAAWCPESGDFRVIVTGASERASPAPALSRHARRSRSHKRLRSYARCPKMRVEFGNREDQFPRRCCLR